MARSVDPTKAANYVIKAEELLKTANDSLTSRRYNSTVTNAVHSSINALDALTVKFKGKRGSDDHTEVLELVKGILPLSQYEDIRKQFTFLISKKNASEYQPDLMTEKDANEAIKWAERILSKVNA
ncbi:MAG: HEPN domain-containing protein, partial [Candidatus Nitrosotalea sp.]|nr:HEPN domain-containing protein [Candidatus Nitrosotalea sp.]